MTTTIESPFGNGVMVNGFLLNNELTDFSFAAKDEKGIYISNRVQSKKRPRSSMSPTIIFNESGLLEAVTGSPGGSQIIGYTAQSIYNMFDFGLDPESAAALPHYQNNNADKTSIEIPIDNVTLEYAIDNLTLDLENRGHVVRHTSMNSGLSIILVSQEDGMLLGGADPRRDGTVGSTVMSDEETDTSYFCPPSSSSHKSSKSHESKKMKRSWSYKSKSSKSNKSKKSKISWSYKSKSSKSQKNRKNTIAY
jgi:gamma-glutamyltranspeptidase/glutathione hydrolase